MCLQERQVIGLPFEGGDVAAETPRLRVGDEVEFRVTLDRRSGQLKATEVHFQQLKHRRYHMSSCDVGRCGVLCDARPALEVAERHRSECSSEAAPSVKRCSAF